MEREIEEIKINENPVKKFDGGPVESPKRILNLLKSRWVKLLGIFFVTIAVVTVIFGFLLGLPVYRAYKHGLQAYAQAKTIKDSLKLQDIKKTTESIVATEKEIELAEKELSAVAWSRNLPLFGSYARDAFHLIKAVRHGLEAAEITTLSIEPYSDLLGLKGQGTFTGGTAEERIAKAVETLDKVTPSIDKIAAEFEVVKEEIDQIDPNRYPEEFQGKKVRARLQEMKNLVDLAGSVLEEARPMVKKLPTLLGAKGEAKYLVLFQNDKELRPTGGFITAYAVFRVEKGKIHLEGSDDIYKLDETITKHVAPPKPISKNLLVYSWRLRDSNFSPDFSSSMKTFEDLYASSSEKKKIDGIIAVDTHALIELMKVLGPISAYGTNFTTEKVPECNCPMVIYELEKYADEPKNYERGNRKDIIGVLLAEILKKALSSGKNVYGALAQVMINEAKQKHVLLYLHDSDAQRGVEALGFAGRIKPTVSGEDYLHVNDANLGGAKSNLFIVSSVRQEVNITDSGSENVLSIEYKYPRRGDNCSLERKSGLCLAGIYRDYLRIYLPSEAKVNQIRGYESSNETTSELGHLVIGGYLTLVPQGFKKIEVKYFVPGEFKSKGEYKTLIQKQPGTEANHYKIVVNGRVTEFDLLEDKELLVKL